MQREVSKRPENSFFLKYCRVPPPRGSKLRWREDMGGGLPNMRELRIGLSLQPTGLPYLEQIELPTNNAEYTPYSILITVTN